MTRRILALNPWHGGSHKAFLDGWIEHSRHAFTVLPLPPFKWKWRMRHSSITLAEKLHTDFDSQALAEFDTLFCTDMLNLAEFRGLCPIEIRRLPTIVYFHENQLTYPVREARERDLHFAYTNLTTALAADAVWFNSAYHRDEFLDALNVFLKRMPDYQHTDSIEAINNKSAIHYPGISDDCFIQRDSTAAPDTGPLRILWVSRWEHDKQPELFFDALRLLRQRGVEFRVSVLGESFGTVPPCFEQARTDFALQIDHWGYAESRTEYLSILRSSDVVISTAAHEFFGIAILEAVAAGCHPLVPNALAYPETLGTTPNAFHDGTTADLTAQLAALSEPGRLATLRRSQQSFHVTSRFAASQRAADMDASVESVTEGEVC